MGESQGKIDDGRGKVSRAMSEASAAYKTLSVTCGQVTLDFSAVWAGWVSLSFAGEVTVFDREGLEDAAIAARDRQGELSGLRLSTAYCSPVLRDLCVDVASRLRGDEKGTIRVFCDAEEHGEPVVDVSADEVVVSDAIAGEGPIASVRCESGSYLSDLASCLSAMRDAIETLDESSRSRILPSVGLFFERVPASGEGVDDEAPNEQEPDDALLGEEAMGLLGDVADALFGRSS